MALITRQYEYNGLVFGRDTAFRTLESVEGLSVSMPDVRADIDDEPEDHGAFVDGEFTGARRIIIPGILLPFGDLKARMNEFRAAFRPRADDLPLKFFPPEGDAEMQVHCRPLRRASPSERIYMTGQAARWAIELVAGDPRIYSASQKTIVIQPGTGSGGFGFPFGFPLSFGGGSSVQGSAINDGTESSPPIARVDGPCVNPKILNDLSGKFIQTNLTLATGDFLDIDFKARTILLNGTASRYNTLTNDSEWWFIEPGTQTVQFIVSGGDANTKLTLNWSDAWM